jgi:hypothetical protein
MQNLAAGRYEVGVASNHFLEDMAILGGERNRQSEAWTCYFFRTVVLTRERQMKDVFQWFS